MGCINESGIVPSCSRHVQLGAGLLIILVKEVILAKSAEWHRHNVGKHYSAGTVHHLPVAGRADQVKTICWTYTNPKSGTLLGIIDKCTLEGVTPQGLNYLQNSHHLKNLFT